MKFVYFGDGLWATKCLERLREEGHQPLAVILRRKPSDETLAAFAQQSGIPVHVPEQVNNPEFVGWVRSIRPDLNISMSYDQIFRQAILESAPLGFSNCHAGKLPYYRGRNVINCAISPTKWELPIRRS